LLVVISENLKFTYVNHDVVVIDLSVINKDFGWEAINRMEVRFDAIGILNAVNPFEEVTYSDDRVRVGGTRVLALRRWIVTMTTCLVVVEASRAHFCVSDGDNDRRCRAAKCFASVYKSVVMNRLALPYFLSHV